MDITFRSDQSITPHQFIDLLERSSLAERRPVQYPEVIAGMLDNADLLVTAWQDGQLVGVSRSVTDFVYCCYLSDLAVDQRLQKSGVGSELIQRTRDALGPRCMLTLLSAPAATGYYPRVGFEAHPSAWIMYPDAPEGDNQ